MNLENKIKCPWKVVADMNGTSMHKANDKLIACRDYCKGYGTIKEHQTERQCTLYEAMTKEY